jgi:hypothetical protein
MSQQRRQSFKGGRGSKEKINQKSVGKKIEEKKHLSFWEDDMRDPCGSSILNVSKAARDPKKRQNSQKLGVKITPRKERFIVHRGWHEGPISEQILQRSKAAGDQKKKEVARN